LCVSSGETLWDSLVEHYDLGVDGMQQAKSLQRATHAAIF
jgi:hypothetical protein